MDPSSVQTTPSVDEDEWGDLLTFCAASDFVIDTDGFVIPSLGIGDPDQNEPHSLEVEDSKPSSIKAEKEENIYLGPHGAPPSQSKQQEQNSSGHKQKLKQTLKEADRKYSATGWENKAENLRELVGVGKIHANMSKSSPKDWLDAHCHESEFERQCPW